MKKLIREAHRRSLWQVLGIYAMGSWVVLQVVDQLVQSAGLPEWVPSLALVLLLIGLPMVMATAFVQEGMPGAGTSEAEPAASAPDPEPAATGEVRPPPTRAEARNWFQRNVFTWRNAIAGGVAAMALFGTATAIWMVLRGAGVGSAGTLVAKGLIEDGERVVLADFSGDSSLAVAATMALRVQLAESGIVSVAEPSTITQALRRMEVTDGPLDQDRAREVAEREGLNAVVAGDVTSAGGSYILTVRVIETSSGGELVTVGETASGSDDFLAAMDRLGRKLRERLGESLGSIRAAAPLSRATTSSTEALRKYSLAEVAFDERDSDQAVTLLDEAIALDSSFAMAWRKLAVSDIDRRIEAATRAYELRDRLTERERYHATAIYQSYVLEDNDEVVTTYRALLEQYPDDATALNNLGVAYRELGQRELAAEMYVRAVEVDPSGAHYYGNLIPLLYNIGEVDSSRVVLDRFAERFPGHPNVIRFQSQFAYVDGDVEGAEAALQPMLSSEVMSLRRQANGHISSFRIRAGKLREGQQIWRESREGATPLDEAMFRAWLEIQVVFDTAAATTRVLAALATAPDSVVDGKAGGLSRFFYDIGDLERGDEFYARDLVVDSLEMANMPERFRPLEELSHEADRAFARGEYQTVLDAEREMERIWLRLSTGQDPANWALGAVPAFEALGQTDSVVVRYETWLGRRNLGGFWGDARNLPRAYERLAQLYDEMGDLEQAAGYYGLFVELWEDADPELQPRVEAARVRMEEIVRERG